MTEKKSLLPTLSFTLLDSYEEPDLWRQAIGKNAKGVLVLSAENEALSRDLFNFLKKVLEAVQIQLEEEALLLLTTPEKHLSFARISREKDIQVLISFGLPAKNLGLHWSVNLYEPLTKNGCLFLFAERLSLIQNDRERKLRLWKALQKIFTP
ncbi:MAG TPA: hypothetical protein ENJ88_00195 [Phaeodactylibacter sp.]|nr:hypothetical protein [Phaeodactylibacter sp.]